MASKDTIKNMLKTVAVLVPTAQQVIKSLRNAAALVERDGPALVDAFAKGQDAFRAARKNAKELDSLVNKLVRQVKYSSGVDSPDEDDLDHLMSVLVGCDKRPAWISDAHQVWWGGREEPE